MRVIARSTLKDFWGKHADSEQPLKSWHKVVSQASWTSPADVKACYATASILKNGRVVFNILNNKYRIVTSVSYAKVSDRKKTLGIVFIKFVGTHAEYDLVDAETVSLPRRAKKNANKAAKK